MEQSFGQKAVSSHKVTDEDLNAIEKAKQNIADAIDQMSELRSSTESGEVKRLTSVAITELQGAQMWMVKALTWKD